MISTEHVLRAQQFDKKLIAQVFDAVEEMETVVARGGSEELRGRIMASLFYFVSTRTRLSFESAMHRLGGSFISTENPQSVSDFASSGHFEDTISMVNQYSDLIVLRHPGSSLVYRAAEVSSIPAGFSHRPGNSAPDPPAGYHHASFSQGRQHRPRGRFRPSGSLFSADIQRSFHPHGSIADTPNTSERIEPNFTCEIVR